MAAIPVTDPVPGIPEDIARAQLAKIAYQVLDSPDSETMGERLARAAIWASKTLRAEQLAIAFADYVNAITDADNFEAGLIETYDVDPEAGDSGHAADIAAERVDKALDFLVYGYEKDTK